MTSPFRAIHKLGVFHSRARSRDSQSAKRVRVRPAWVSTSPVFTCRPDPNFAGKPRSAQSCFAAGCRASAPNRQEFAGPATSLSSSKLSPGMRSVNLVIRCLTTSWMRSCLSGQMARACSTFLQGRLKPETRGYSSVCFGWASPLSFCIEAFEKLWQAKMAFRPNSVRKRERLSSVAKKRCGSWM